MKKLISLLMCLILVMALPLPAYAEEDGTEPTSQSQSEGTGGNSGDTSDDSKTEDSGGSKDESTSGDQNEGSGEATEGTVPKDHTHTWVKVTVPSTCAEEGGTVVMCSTCGAVDSVEVTPKLDHTYDSVCDAECNVCKAIREVKHKFSAAWSRNSRKHWHTCSVCGAKDGEADHYPGPAATEERDQFCLTCGLLMTPRLGHTHKYDPAWTVDGTGHWHACAGCDVQKDFESHVYDDPCNPQCSVCGYTAPAANSYGDAYSADENGHWAFCTLCGEMTVPEAHIPAETAAEDEATLCVVCGYELAPAKAHTHEFGPDWFRDETDHWKTCQCGETSDKSAHTWDEGTEDKAQGVIVYLCTVCGAERSEAIPEVGFPWAIVLTALGAAILGCVVTLIVLLVPPKRSRKFLK